MKYKKEVYQTMTLILQFGINMVVPIFLCTFIGLWADRKLGTNFFFIIMFFLGAAAGMRNIFLFSKKIYDKPKGAQYSSYDDNSTGTNKQQ